MSTDDHDLTFATGFVTPGRRKNKLDATVDPTVTDDADSQYEVLSRWANVTDDTLWECVDSTVGAAVWKQIDATATAASTVTDETTFGIASAVGTDTEYARQDHTHGTPADPVTLAALTALGLVGTIVMSEDITDPPEPVWTEDGTDYIYSEVGQ